MAKLDAVLASVELVYSVVKDIRAAQEEARKNVERALNSVADIRTVANATGLGNQRVQQYQYAFARGAGLSEKESGGVLEQVATLLGRAKQGDPSALAFVQRYGIASSPEKLAGLSADSFLKQGLAGLAGQTDPAQRMADAALLGGAEAAAKLSASVAELNSKLEAWASEAETVRAVLTSEEVARAERAVKLQNFQTYDDSVRAQRETLAGYSERGGLDFVDGNSIAVMAERRAQAAADLAEAHVALEDLAREAQSGKVVVAQLMTAYQNVVDMPDRIKELSAAIDGALMRARIEQRIEDDQGRKRNGRAGENVGDWGPAGGQFPAPRASGGPVSAYAPYMVGERGPELFVPRASGAIVSNRALGASQWPWSAASPEVGAAKDAIGELQELLDELDFDWQGTFNRMTDVLLDFAKTGKFEWRDLAKIALDSIEQMLRAWLELQAQKMAGGEGERPVIVNLNVSPGVPEAVRREKVALRRGLALAA